MDNNPFLKRLMKDKMEDVAHSSVYAKAQNSKGLGATSTESFTARQRIDRNRQNVGVYNDSEVVTGTGDRAIRATKYNAQRDASQRAAVGKYGSRQFGSGIGMRSKVTVTPSQSRKAPPARRNPGISW